jgi:hypothetical protein
MKYLPEPHRPLPQPIVRGTAFTDPGFQHRGIKSGESALVVAVLNQSIQDFCHGVVDVKFRHREDWRSAWCWLTDNRTETFSFIWCCEMVGSLREVQLDPQRIRRRLVRYFFEKGIRTPVMISAPVRHGEEYEQEVSAA